MQVENSIHNFRERELEAGIPGNDREREFPLTPATMRIAQCALRIIITIDETLNAVILLM